MTLSLLYAAERWWYADCRAPRCAPLLLRHVTPRCHCRHFAIGCYAAADASIMSLMLLIRHYYHCRRCRATMMPPLMFSPPAAALSLMLSLLPLLSPMMRWCRHAAIITLPLLPFIFCFQYYYADAAMSFSIICWCLLADDAPPPISFDMIISPLFSPAAAIIDTIIIYYAWYITDATFAADATLREYFAAASITPAPFIFHATMLYYADAAQTLFLPLPVDAAIRRHWCRRATIRRWCFRPPPLFHTLPMLIIFAATAFRFLITLMRCWLRHDAAITPIALRCRWCQIAIIDATLIRRLLFLRLLFLPPRATLFRCRDVFIHIRHFAAFRHYFDYYAAAYILLPLLMPCCYCATMPLPFFVIIYVADDAIIDYFGDY